MRLQVVLLNGGGEPSINLFSHLQHVRQLSDLLLRQGLAAADITIFNADGTDPAADFAVRELQPEIDFWLLRGTRLTRHLRTRRQYENSTVDGFTVRPATRTALHAWFTDAAQHLRPGDTLLFYVTDHGTKNDDDLTNNSITLWGNKEALSVTELRQLFGQLDPGVRVITLMSQCYSGSFAHLMYLAADATQPVGNVCGFFSATADREAHGCYAESRDKDHIGHSFAFLEGLAAGQTFPEAHARTLVSDRTPDVPLTTSDVYVERLLAEVARQRGQPFEALVDEFLRLAWHDTSVWEAEIRLLDRIGQAFGSFSPRSLAELQEYARLLPEISAQFTTYGKAWDAAFRALAVVNLERFLTQYPHWQERLSESALAALDATARRDVTPTLLTELAAFTRADPATSTRLHVLRDKADSAAQAAYRMEVRLGVVLRMRIILTSIAGRVYLAQAGVPEQQQAYTRLTTCEALALPGPAVPLTLSTPAEPFPSYDEEKHLAATVLPGWMGIRFQQAPAPVRTQGGLLPGASVVQVVYPNSPAQQAGLAVGDIILGPPEVPFSEPQQIREWVMMAPIGVSVSLHILREEQSLHLSLTPQPYPPQWPALPGPPQVGGAAPPLPDLHPYRGPLPATLTGGGPYLLFFWATWCGPCKASLPEVLAFERASGIPVIAITDEAPDRLDAFFAKYQAPFPAIVAVDTLRRASLAYGVSGTPTFVLTDVAGQVQRVLVGYRTEVGLTLPGWAWAKP